MAEMAIGGAYCFVAIGAILHVPTICVMYAEWCWHLTLTPRRGVRFCVCSSITNDNLQVEARRHNVQRKSSMPAHRPICRAIELNNGLTVNITALLHQPQASSNFFPVTAPVNRSRLPSLVVFHHNGSIHTYKINEEKEKKDKTWLLNY